MSLVGMNDGGSKLRFPELIAAERTRVTPGPGTRFEDAGLYVAWPRVTLKACKPHLRHRDAVRPVCPMRSAVCLRSSPDDPVTGLSREKRLSLSMAARKVTRRRAPAKTPPPPPTGPVRLQRYLASAGLGSRRHCEQFITEGRVTVDGEVAELGMQVDPESQEITFDGEVLRKQRTKYFALNKPVGFICSHRDPAGRPQVTDLFPRKGPRLFTVGRLDENSEGLMLVTNDGELANQLAHPRYRIDRIYRVQVAGHPPRETLKELEQGLYFDGGRFRCESVRPIKKQGKSTHLEIRIREGRNREIRRLLARVGYKVMRLERVGFGPLRLGRLKPGEHRELRPSEVMALRELVRKTALTRSRPPERRRAPKT